MKLKKSSAKAKTISELAGLDARAFGRFIREKQGMLLKAKNEAEPRKPHCADRDVVWTA